MRYPAPVVCEGNSLVAQGDATEDDNVEVRPDLEASQLGGCGREDKEVKATVLEDRVEDVSLH